MGLGKVFSELLKYRQSKDEVAYGSPSDNEDFSFRVVHADAEAVR